MHVIAGNGPSADDRRKMHSDSRAPAHEVLAGFVERVTFHNEENGFLVLRTKVRGSVRHARARASLLSGGRVIYDDIGAFGAYLDDPGICGRAPSKEKELEVLKGWSHSDLYDKLEPVGHALGSAAGFAACGSRKRLVAQRMQERRPA
jgi:hypothetical protein